MKLRHLFLFCVICCSVSIFAQNKSKLPKRVVILFSLVGMPIRRGLCLEMNTGFILPILPLMMIRYSWMLSHQKIW